MIILTSAKSEAEDFSGLTEDAILGDLLYTTALSYHAEGGMPRIAHGTVAF